MHGSSLATPLVALRRLPLPALLPSLPTVFVRLFNHCMRGQGLMERLALLEGKRVRLSVTEQPWHFDIPIEARGLRTVQGGGIRTFPSAEPLVISCDSPNTGQRSPSARRPRGIRVSTSSRAAWSTAAVAAFHCCGCADMDRNKHAHAAFMCISDPRLRFLRIEVQAREVARVETVAKPDVSSVCTMIDRCPLGGQAVGRTHQLHAMGRCRARRALPGSAA